MAIKTLVDLFIHDLSDVYSAEKQITRALPKMARAATDASLKAAFEAHLEETRGQIERLDQIVSGAQGGCLGFDEAAKLLAETLQEEKATDEKLNVIAEKTS